MSRLAPGTRLGSYQIVAVLGAGGMGEVYRARDARLDREIALKVLPGTVAGDAERLARFEREAKTIAALNHPHIVTIHSIEEADGVRFLTMELVEGQSLDQLIGGELPMSRVLSLAVSLADALAAAHEKGIVHRDLKPGNVMVSREGRVKVLDFGLAKSAQPESLVTTQAMTVASPVSSAGQVVGTVPYMAPEQLRGEPVDARADLFSFGILLFEMLTGRRPFAGESSAEVSSAILRDVPEPVRQLRPAIPADLERIVARCLEKDRERRFQTAKDVRNELELLQRNTAGAPAPAARRAAPAAAPSDTPSIAVLPFANRSHDAEDEYFSDGLADELINVLAKIRGLRVAARTSTATFKGKTATVAEIGRTLKVAAVLEGSVRKAGNRVRISVQLVKVEDGYPLWSETYDRTLDDIFAVQDDIAQSVVRELRTRLLGEEPDSKASGEVRAEIAAAARGRGRDPESYRLAMQARHLIDRLSQKDTEAGVRYLEQALCIDPDYAMAWVQLAGARINQAGFGWRPQENSLELAHDALRRGLALDPDLPDAHAVLGRIQATFDWDWAAAEASYRRSLERAPDNVEALLGLGTLETYRTRFDSAESLLFRVVELDPLNGTARSRLSWIHRSRGRFAEGRQILLELLEINPQRIVAHLILAALSMEEGNFDRAMQEIQDEPEEWSRLTGLAMIHARAGRRAESDAALDRLVANHADNSAYQVAVVHAQREEADACFAWLDRAYQQRDGGLPFVMAEPLFLPVHGDPRWRPFLRKMRLAD